MVELGIIGTGIFAKRSHLPAIQQTKYFTIGGVFNRTSTKAEEFAAAAVSEGQRRPRVFESIEDIITAPEIGALDVLVPVQYNLEIVTKAINAQKPVAIEKPIAASLDDARKIVQLADSTDLPVMVLENWCYHNATRKLRELLPRIGHVVLFTYQATNGWMLSPYHGTKWRQNPEHAGGFLSDSGVHDFGLITEVLGEVNSVSALATQLHVESGAMDTLSSQLSLDSGVIGTYTQGRYLGATKSGVTFSIFGTEGSLVLESVRDSITKISIYTGSGAADTAITAVDVPAEQINGVVPEFANFAEAVRTGDKSVIVATPAKAFHQYAVMVALVGSAENGGQRTKVEKL